MEKLSYICHPFADDQVTNRQRVMTICRSLRHSCVPVAPHLLLPWYVDESTERDLALRHCTRLIAAVDEVLVFGDPTAGMRVEIDEAKRLGIPVRRVDR